MKPARKPSFKKYRKGLSFEQCRPLFIAVNVMLVLLVLLHYSPPDIIPRKTRKLLPKETSVKDLQAIVAHVNADGTVQTEAARLDKGMADTAISKGAQYWLTIGIPTVPRRDNVDYLKTTVETLIENLPSDPTDPFFGKIRIIVMNNKPGEHIVFQEVQQHYSGAQLDGPSKTAASHIEFVNNPGLLKDPNPELPDPDDLNNPSSRPGRHVRQQTCDVISLLKMVKDSHYYMFMEDDFRTCSKTFDAIRYALGLANEMVSDWLAMRVSYGMNGVLFRAKDLTVFEDYLWKNVARLPPDLLWTGYMEGRDFDENGEKERIYRGKLAVFRYNLFDHIGTVSSFAIRPDRPKWPGCYESMASVWSLQMSERYDIGCQEFDLSPCVGVGVDSERGRKYKEVAAFNPP